MNFRIGRESSVKKKLPALPLRQASGRKASSRLRMPDTFSLIWNGRCTDMQWSWRSPKQSRKTAWFSSNRASWKNPTPCREPLMPTAGSWKKELPAKKNWQSIKEWGQENEDSDDCDSMLQFSRLHEKGD